MFDTRTLYTTDPFTAPLAELLFSVFAVVIGGFVYGSIIGNMTELTRRRNMVGDIPKMKVRHSGSHAVILGSTDAFPSELLDSANGTLRKWHVGFIGVRVR